MILPSPTLRHYRGSPLTGSPNKRGIWLRFTPPKYSGEDFRHPPDIRRNLHENEVMQ